MTTAAGSCGVWLTLQPPDIIEQGKWLNILIKETGCGSPVAKQQPGGVASDDEGRGSLATTSQLNLTSGCLCFGQCII